MQKIKGTGLALDRRQKNIYTYYRNTVYHYRFPDLQLVRSFKSLSNISALSLSENEKLLAVVNTSGAIAAYSTKSDEAIGSSRLARIELYFAHFVNNDTGMLCADWNGRIIWFDLPDCTYTIRSDLKYEEREFPLWLILDPYNMQVLAIDGVSAAMI